MSEREKEDMVRARSQVSGRAYVVGGRSTFPSTHRLQACALPLVTKLGRSVSLLETGLMMMMMTTDMRGLILVLCFAERERDGE